MKIVLGFDDSPHAQAALNWVIRQRWPEPAQVTVVSAVRTPVGTYAEVYAPAAAYPVEVFEELQRHHEELTMRAQDALKRAGFKTEAKVAPGDPREVLLDAAKAANADLIVVGSHGRTGLSKLLLGSVASHVVAHAPCDVLVVKRTT